MSALSLDLSPSTVARRSRRRGLFARLLAALQQSRLRSAQEVIARHRHLLPADFERVGDWLDGRSEDRLPFIRND